MTEMTSVGQDYEYLKNKSEPEVNFDSGTYPEVWHRHTPKGAMIYKEIKITKES